MDVLREALIVLMLIATTVAQSIGNLPLAPSLAYTRMPIANYVPSLCSQCYCPLDHQSNPYQINCRSRLLEILPPIWEPFMRPGTTTVDNIHLDYTGNHVRFVQQLPYSQVLDALILDENEIDIVVSFAFSNLTHLKYLSLKSNQIEYLTDDVFRTYSGRSLPIEILDLRCNQLHHLDDDVFQSLERLVELRLGGNPFGVLDGSTVTALNGLRLLSSLDLSNAALTDLPYSLINPIRRLEELDLSRNGFRKVPEVIQMAGRLLRLNLDGNAMDELDAASFVGLSHLEKLNVSFMPNLKIIYAGTFQLLPRLQILNCAHNPRLETIEKFTFSDHLGQGPTSMQLVNLRHNNLTSLNYEILEGIRIRALDVQENPWRCSCQLTWLKQRQQADELVSELRCMEPISLSGKLLVEAEIEQPNCPEQEEKDLHLHSFTRLRNTIYRNNVLLAIVLSLGSVLILGMAIYLARTGTGLRYTVMRHQRRSTDALYANRSFDNEACDVYTVTNKQ